MRHARQAQSRESQRAVRWRLHLVVLFAAAAADTGHQGSLAGGGSRQAVHGAIRMDGVVDGQNRVDLEMPLVGSLEAVATGSAG